MKALEILPPPALPYRYIEIYFLRSFQLHYHMESYNFIKSFVDILDIFYMASRKIDFFLWLNKYLICWDWNILSNLLFVEIDIVKFDHSHRSNGGFLNYLKWRFYLLKISFVDGEKQVSVKVRTLLSSCK